MMGQDYGSINDWYQLETMGEDLQYPCIECQRLGDTPALILWQRKTEKGWQNLCGKCLLLFTKDSEMRPHVDSELEQSEPGLKKAVDILKRLGIRSGGFTSKTANKNLDRRRVRVERNSNE